MHFKKKKISPRVRLTHNSNPEPREAVFSYHANRSIRSASDVRKVDNIDQQTSSIPAKPFLHHITPIIALVLVAMLVALCTQLKAPVKIVLVGNESQQAIALYGDSMAGYQNAANSYFSSISSRNKLTVNTSKIASQLKDKFPEIDAVTISLPLVGSKPVAYIQLATPKFALVSNNQTYLLNSDGRVLTTLTTTQASTLSSIKVPVVADQSGLAVTAGQIILPESTVAFITEVLEQLQANNMQISSMNLPAGEAELDIHIVGQGYYVKYNIYGDAREEAGTYLAVEATLKSQGKTPSQYIDVRVPNRAYYK